MVRPLIPGLHEDLIHCVFFSLLPTHCHHLYAKQCDAILWGEYIRYKNFALFIYWKARVCSCQCKRNKGQYFIYCLFRIHLAGDQENGSFLLKLELLVPPSTLCQKRGGHEDWCNRWQTKQTKNHKQCIFKKYWHASDVYHSYLNV